MSMFTFTFIFASVFTFIYSYLCVQTCVCWLLKDLCCRKRPSLWVLWRSRWSPSVLLSVCVYTYLYMCICMIWYVSWEMQDLDHEEKYLASLPGPASFWELASVLAARCKDSNFSKRSLKSSETFCLGSFGGHCRAAKGV